MRHERSIWEIMLSILFGIEQKIRDLMPDWVIRAEKMAKMPPSWWYKFKRWEEWYYATDADGYPLAHWFPAYFDCCWSWLGLWVDEVGKWAYEEAVAIVRQFTGLVQFGYSTFQGWITALWDRVGGFVPWFADSIADAAIKLYNWLPYEIRSGLKSWADLFTGIINQVHQWAQDRYDDVRNWYYGLRVQIQDWIIQVRGWWLMAHDFLDDFRHNAENRVREWLGGAWQWLVNFWNNPVGTITGYLGETWTKLYTFARDCLTFWYNLWGQYATDIGAFWGNPLRWLYDRVEDFLVSRW